MPAWKNVAYAGVSREEAMSYLERFGLGSQADARPGELSGGERQSGAVGGAVAREATAGLARACAVREPRRPLARGAAVGPGSAHPRGFGTRARGRAAGV